jgi:hypothetical protein
VDKKEKVNHSEARDLISKIVKSYDEEPRNKEKAFYPSSATKRAAAYCGKSEAR